LREERATVTFAMRAVVTTMPLEALLNQIVRAVHVTAQRNGEGAQIGKAG
jgi:hypothetical protein